MNGKSDALTILSPVTTLPISGVQGSKLR